MRSSYPGGMAGLPPPDEPKPPFGRTRHPFFMHEMIRRQAISVRATVAAARTDAAGIPAPPDNARLLFTGLGTSFHAALATARAAGPVLDYRFPVDARPAFDLLLEPEALEPPFVAMLFTASGQTVLTLHALEALKERKIRTVVVTSERTSPIAQLADHLLETRYSQENSWTHTASYTAAIAAAVTLLLAWNSGEGMDEDPLADAITSALAMESTVLEKAEEFQGLERFVLLGSGPGEATAREGALKLREAAGRFATAVGVEEFLHGVLPSIDERTAAIALASTELERHRAEQALNAARLVGAKTLLIDSSGGPPMSTVLTLPPQPAWLSPIAQVIPLQLLAYWTAVADGRNPDVMGLNDPKQLAARRSFGI